LNGAPSELLPFWRNRPYFYAVLALFALVIFFAAIRPWGMEEDYWETSAAVRAIAENPLHPVNPLLGTGENTSPRFVPYTLVWGIFMRFSRLSLFTVMFCAMVANYWLLVSGVHRFVVRQFKRADLPLYVLGAMLLLWGKGYSQANAYQLELLLVSLPLTGIFTFALCFHALAAARGYLDERRARFVFEYVLLSVIAFITHPITALLIFVGVFSILLAEKKWWPLVWLQVVPLLALGAALLWPYFDYGTVLFKGSTEAWFYMPMFSNRPLAIGTAFVAVPVLAYYALRKEHLELVYGTLICLMIYVASDALHVLIGARFLFWAMVFAQTATAVFVLDRGLLTGDTLRKSLRTDGVVFVLVAAILLPCLMFRANELRKFAVQGWTDNQVGEPYMRMADPFVFLASYLDNTDVVMADLITGWPVPALSGARLVAQAKGNPLMQAEIERRRGDATAFFERPLSIDDRRALLKIYKVTHILWNEDEKAKYDPLLIRDLERLGREVVARGPVKLYEVVP
jgi:hypothetical protein